MQEENTTSVIFPSLLRNEMKAQGCTQAVLAASIGVTQAAVSKWLNGTIPKGDQLLTLAQRLHVTMEWLLTGDEPKRPTYAMWGKGFYLGNFPKPEDVDRAGEQDHVEKGEDASLDHRGGYIAFFRFHPSGHPEALSGDEKLRFHKKYVRASEDEKRQMLSLGQGTEKFFNSRVLNAFAVLMQRQLEEER